MSEDGTLQSGNTAGAGCFALTRANLVVMLRHYQGIDSADSAAAALIASFLESEPAAFERSTAIGHMTASAWIASPDGERVLLLHHRKLGRWLQPGGHADGDENLVSVARREMLEECGISDATLVSSEAFDVDVHVIPARPPEPEHLHYDVRFAFVADDRTPPVRNEESVDLRWFDVAELESVTSERSVLRMRDKWIARLGRTSPAIASP